MARPRRRNESEKYHLLVSASCQLSRACSYSGAARKSCCLSSDHTTRPRQGSALELAPSRLSQPFICLLFDHPGSASLRACGAALALQERRSSWPTSVWSMSIRSAEMSTYFGVLSLLWQYLAGYTEPSGEARFLGTRRWDCSTRFRRCWGPGPAEPRLRRRFMRARRSSKTRCAARRAEKSLASSTTPK